ncbi:MAG: hypothetical protein HOM87_13140 [Proteobacteria bacterium]|nr:hypothetical protein [Pseudomonadota bacterium]
MGFAIGHDLGGSRATLHMIDGAVLGDTANAVPDPIKALVVGAAGGAVEPEARAEVIAVSSEVPSFGLKDMPGLAQQEIRLVIDRFADRMGELFLVENIFRRGLPGGIGFRITHGTHAFGGERVKVVGDIGIDGGGEVLLDGVQVLIPASFAGEGICQRALSEILGMHLRAMACAGAEPSKGEAGHFDQQVLELAFRERA